jgi:hypothetical protein
MEDLSLATTGKEIRHPLYYEHRVVCPLKTGDGCLEGTAQTETRQ